MDQFDCCPESILHDIVSRFQSPSHLVSLSLTCKRMHELVAPFLRLKKKCQSLSASFLDDGTWLSIRALPYVEFQDILNRRDLSFCVHEASIKIDFSDEIRFCGSPGRNFHLLPQSEELGLLETAVDDLGVREWEDSYLFLKILRSRWGTAASTGIHEWEDYGPLLETLRLGGPEAGAALFLLMLGNLEKLVLQVRSYEDWISWVIRKVVLCDPSRLPKVSYGFLSLREVRFSDWDGDNFLYCLSLDRLAPFFLLPSLEKLFGDMVYHEEKFKWDGEFGVSSVTEIHFQYSFLSAEAFGEFLRIPKALNKFSYGGTIISDGEEFDDDEILRVISRTQPALPLSNVEIFEGERPG